MMKSAMYCLSEVPLPSFDSLQEAVDGLGLLFRLELVSVVCAEGAISQARLEGRETTFLCEPVSQGVERPRVDVRNFAGWRHVTAFGGRGLHIQSTAAMITCIACVAATRGAVYSVNGGLETDIASFRQWLDFMVTYDLREYEAYYTRYPDERPTGEPQGPMEIVVTVN